MEGAGKEEGRTGGFSELSAKQREAAVASMPRGAKDAATALAKEATTCRSPAAIMSALETLAEALGAGGGSTLVHTFSGLNWTTNLLYAT